MAANYIYLHTATSYSSHHMSAKHMNIKFDPVPLQRKNIFVCDTHKLHTST